MPADKKPGSKRWAGLGFEMAAGVVGFALVGYWLGRYYGNGAVGLVIGAALGVVGGMYNLIRASIVTSREESDRARESDSSQKS